MRVDERSGHPTWAQVEELETKIERLETELLEAEGIIEEVCGETEMKPNDDGTKNGAKSPRPTCGSVMRRDAVEYGAALDEIRKAYRSWRTGERGYVGMCNDIDQFLKTVEK